MWYGDVANIPEDWHICDGTENTPDLRNRFVYGAGGEGHTVGEIGGEENVTLNVEQIPSHTHRINMYVSYTDTSASSDFVYPSMTATGTRYTNTESTGGTKSHQNMPPYMVLYYIMKIK